MQKERHKLVPSSYLVLIRDGKILLLRRFNTGWMDGYYSFVAGHAESGETFPECIIREAKEEAGIGLKQKDLEVVHVMHRKSDGVENERIDVFIKAKKYYGEIKNMEPDKCSGLKWFDIDRLPENIIPYIRQAIENIQSRLFYSEFGW